MDLIYVGHYLCSDSLLSKLESAGEAEYERGNGNAPARERHAGDAPWKSLRQSTALPSHDGVQHGRKTYHKLRSRPGKLQSPPLQDVATLLFR